MSLSSLVQGWYRITPSGYAHMTHLLSGLAGGRVVIALEVRAGRQAGSCSSTSLTLLPSPLPQGGYNLTSISNSMCACAGVLLGDPLPRLAGDMTPNNE